MKRNEGFTLIELLVTVSVGTLVTFAAISLLLLGARVQYRTTQESADQQTIRVAMALLEDMAGSGAFDRIETTYNGWKLLKATKNADNEEVEVPVFEYVNTEQTIYRGEYHPEGEGNEPVLTGLNNAGVAMEGNLVRLSFETDRGASYVTRVYCRTASVTDTQAEVEDTTEVKNFYQNSVAGNRLTFLNTLAGEYNGGQNTGKIMDVDDPWTYYSEWYIGGYEDHPGWNKDTPWCACFVSWAAEKNGVSDFKFADVDRGVELFEKAGKDDIANNGAWKTSNPKPGDYIFFDWTGDKNDPAHVGAVLDVSVEDGVTYVYTIEGNSSGRVAVRKYNVNDDVIMGYGILPGFE